MLKLQNELCFSSVRFQSLWVQYQTQYCPCVKELVTGVFTFIVLRTNVVVKYLIKSSSLETSWSCQELGFMVTGEQKTWTNILWDWDSISFCSSPMFQIREFLDPIHMGPLLGIWLDPIHSYGSFQERCMFVLGESLFLLVGEPWRAMGAHFCIDGMEISTGKQI